MEALRRSLRARRIGKVAAACQDPLAQVIGVVALPLASYRGFRFRSIELLAF